jgi:hypothetical protein
MTNRSKAITGVSGLTVLLFIFHFAHVINLITEANDALSDDAFKNIHSNIILRDSFGNADTIPLEKYLDDEKNKSIYDDTISHK